MVWLYMLIVNVIQETFLYDLDIFVRKTICYFIIIVTATIKLWLV